MNRALTFYKKFGRVTDKLCRTLVWNRENLKVNVVMKQTPGRHQYYYTETLHLLPEDIVFKVRMPSRYALSVESKKYDNLVEKEIINYLEKRVGVNLFDPAGGLHLDLTVKQAKEMIKASDYVKEKASTDEFQAVLEAYNSSEANVDSIQTSIDNTVEELYAELEAYKRNLYRDFKEAEIPSTSPVTDFIPFVKRSNIEIIKADIEAALQKDPENEILHDLLERCHIVVHTYVKIAEIKYEVINDWVDYGDAEEYDHTLLETATKKSSKARNFYSSLNFPSELNCDNSPFEERLDRINKTDLPSFRENLKSYETNKTKRDGFYSQFIKDHVYDFHPEKLKNDLFAFLSGAIVLKDHRYRYQQEQYERYLFTVRWIPFGDHLTLRKVAKYYSKGLRMQVAMSHNWLCPQIDANYDDYGKRTVNPISSTVFYYFFSANRSRRIFAQYILSAARYPNEKLRRAYLRFFSNA